MMDGSDPNFEERVNDVMFNGCDFDFQREVARTAFPSIATSKIIETGTIIKNMNGVLIFFIAEA